MGWLVLFAALLLLIIVVLLVWSQKTDSAKGNQPGAVATTAVPPAKIKKFRRKEIRGRETKRIVVRTAPFSQPKTNNGGFIAKREINLDLDAICRQTGRSIRVCKCPKHESERVKHGLQ